MRKPLAEKNYSLTLSAADLLVPGQENSVKKSVVKGLDLFSAAMGKQAPGIEDVEMSSLSAAFRLDNSLLSLTDIALRTNFIGIDAGITIDGPAGKADAALEAAIGSSRLKMSASGPLTAPEIKPLLSGTLSARFKRALAEIEGSLLQIFPVTLGPGI
jgi:hypothetical protein